MSRETPRAATGSGLPRPDAYLDLGNIGEEEQMTDAKLASLIKSIFSDMQKDQVLEVKLYRSIADVDLTSLCRFANCTLLAVEFDDETEETYLYLCKKR